MLAGSTAASEGEGTKSSFQGLTLTGGDLTGLWGVGH